VDECFIGGVEVGVRGRLSKSKANVIIAVERRGARGAAGRVRMQRIHDFKSDTLVGVIERTCQPGSTIMTDGLSAYHPLTRRGYVHEAHNIKRSEKKAHELMPALHRVSAEVKRWRSAPIRAQCRLSSCTTTSMSSPFASTAATHTTAGGCSTRWSSTRHARLRARTPNC
jgi:transposase-like protein